MFFLERDKLKTDKFFPFLFCGDKMKSLSLALDKLTTSLCRGAIAHGGGISPFTPICLPLVARLFGRTTSSELRRLFLHGVSLPYFSPNLKISFVSFFV